MKNIMIRLFGVLMILSNTSIYAEQSVAQQNLLNDYVQYQEVTKKANEMWESSSVTLQLDKQKFQDKEITEKLVKNVTLVN